MEALLVEIETIVASGTRLNLDYCINDRIDEDVKEMIYDYFRTANTDSLDEAYAILRGEGISYEEIRLIRIKFMSEMAN